MKLTREEKMKYIDTLKLLHSSKVDCRQFINLKIVFLNEDKEGVGAVNEEQFRVTCRKSLKKTDTIIEDAIINVLKNENGLISYQELCKMLDFYQYCF